jgi:uncharacterized protein
LGPAPAASPRAGQPAHLPEAYGTGRLTLLARDPHWLYAHWDLTPQQQRRYNALAMDRHLVVRVEPGTLAGHATTDTHVHPESRSWFIHVEGAATRYSAQLGYYAPGRKWVRVAAATPVTTPPDTASPDRTLRFATIPAEVPLRRLVVPARLPKRPEPPVPKSAPQPAFAGVIQRLPAPQSSANSLAIPALLGAPLEQEHLPSSPVPPVPAGARLEDISSPAGGEAPPPKGFWLNVNAELILYGATEPDAALTVGGRPILLRPDGTFSFRFALPDGTYELMVSALSPEGDLRQAHLTFTRSTDLRGEVAAAPQDPSLGPPAAEHL